ncbi:hypothetical protein EB796_004771 [Bugula neritina]|uniref:Uncharacterized protein n=1 Tax=Bugula neritina TaxID=10212 RepID=A0A7J7KF59_BUGNE|nr:hypothetical protein EB796_004771 [Bugula neritina]
MQFQCHSNAIPEVDALQATPARVQATPARVQATPVRVQATPARVQATPARESCSVPQVEHHNEISDNCQAIPAASDSGKLYMNDLDLLYTIAETYNLGGEPDTLSYISNCLQSKKTWMARRHTHHSSQLFSDTAGMLESDQLYPDSIQPSKTSLKDKSKLKKVSRRQSVAASGNVYITDKGRPLIL